MRAGKSVSTDEMIEIVSQWALARGVRDLGRLIVTRRDGSNLIDTLIPSANLEARHSDDYRFVHWFGADYKFSPVQAVVVKVLWLAWENGLPEVGGETLLEDAGSESDRVRDLFRKNAAWNKMIVPGESKGSLRLSEPSQVG